LDNPGSQDITSLVDFKKLIILAKSYKLNIENFSTQREFFLKYGIKERTKKIIEKSTKQQKDNIKKGLKRLIDKNNMGSLFKVLVVSKYNDK
jgi:cyclopropane-fatty-acyl-phospholipid synthase